MSRGGSRVFGLAALKATMEAVHEDVHSVEALEALISAITEGRLDCIYEDAGGRIALATISFYVEPAESIAGELYLNVGKRGVNVDSLAVRKTHNAIWLFADRWGDSLIVALDAQTDFSLLLLHPEFWK